MSPISMSHLVLSLSIFSICAVIVAFRVNCHLCLLVRAVASNKIVIESWNSEMERNKILKK